MSDSPQQLYDRLCGHVRQTALLGSVESLLYWDERTKMPAAGAQHRAEQMTLLAGIIHQRWTDPALGRWLAARKGQSRPKALSLRSTAISQAVSPRQSVSSGSATRQ